MADVKRMNKMKYYLIIEDLLGNILWEVKNVEWLCSIVLDPFIIIYTVFELCASDFSYAGQR